MNLPSLAQYDVKRIPTIRASTPMIAKRAGMLPSTMNSSGTLISEIANCPKLGSVKKLI